MVREPITDDCKSQETQMDSRPHQPTQGTQQHWIMWKKSNKQDVHEPVTVSGMADMRSQDN